MGARGVYGMVGLGLLGVRFWIVAFGHSFCFFGWELGTGIGVLSIFIFIFTRRTPKVAALGGAIAVSPPRRNGVSRQARVGHLGDHSGSGEFPMLYSLFFVSCDSAFVTFVTIVFLHFFFVVLFHKTYIDIQHTP
jgi:hypothetical protein